MLDVSPVLTTTSACLSFSLYLAQSLSSVVMLLLLDLTSQKRLLFPRNDDVPNITWKDESNAEML